MPMIGSVADDLTGATTTGVLLARSQAATAVYFNAEAAAAGSGGRELDAVIISTNSRPLPAAEAYEKAAAAYLALKQMGVRYFSKRIDTTLRGGIGVEIDAMLDLMDADAVAVVVPAMPQSRRILVGGYSVIDSVLLTRTPAARDVRTPVKECFVPALLSGQSKRKVGLITIACVEAGAEKIKEELKAQKKSGVKIIVVDAITLENVDQIAKACISLGGDVLAADPGPFTAKLAYNRGHIREEQPDIPNQEITGGKTVLIAAGSATLVTKKQIETLCRDPRHISLHVDARALIANSVRAETAVEKAVNTAVGLLNRDMPPRAIVFETALQGEILDLSREDKAHGYPAGKSADLINGGLGMIIAKVLERAGREKIAGLYATGGDTMVNVCCRLGAECLEMIDYVIAQADIGRLIGNYDGLPIVGKGGLTGNDNTAGDIVDRLFKEATRPAIKK